MQGARFMPTIMGMALGHSILAWGMLTANGMPTFGDSGEHGECWHGECREQLLCQECWHGLCYWNLGMGNATSIWYANYIGMALATEMFPILAWYVLPAIAVPEKKFY
jgi:hypothetical protein